MDDEVVGSEKENGLVFIAGVTLNRLSLVEVEAVAGKLGKADGGFGITNWETGAGVSVVIAEGPGVDDEVVECLELLSNSDCTVIRRFL